MLGSSRDTMESRATTERRPKTRDTNTSAASTATSHLDRPTLGKSVSAQSPAPKKQISTTSESAAVQRYSETTLKTSMRGGVYESSLNTLTINNRQNSARPSHIQYCKRSFLTPEAQLEYLEYPDQKY